LSVDIPLLINDLALKNNKNNDIIKIDDLKNIDQKNYEFSNKNRFNTLMRNVNGFSIIFNSFQLTFTLLLMNITLPENSYYFLRFSSVYFWADIPNYLVDDLDYKSYIFLS
jgi:hypothetical protein